MSDAASSKEVRRWTLTHVTEQRSYISQHSYGEFVRFNDYDSREGELLAENERLRAALRKIISVWRTPERMNGESDLEFAQNERDRLYSIAADALAGNGREATHGSAERSTQQMIGVLSRRVVQMGNQNRDHACPQCMPEGGRLVDPSFTCAYHLAAYFVTCPEFQVSPAATQEK